MDSELEGDRVDEGAGGSVKSPRFTRSYVACVPCRVRKVRCIIKGDPPCAKCRREHRECEFDQRPKGPKQREAPKWTRRSRRTGTEIRSASETLHDQRSKSQHVQSPPPEDETTDEFSHVDTAANVPSRPEETAHSRASPDSNPHLYNRVMATPLTGPNDALDILSAAVPRVEQASRLRDPNPTPTPSQHSASSPTKAPTVIPNGSGGLGFTISSLSIPDEATLDLWDKTRFVRQDWFTAQEAVTFVDLFYKYLAPLSAIIVEDFCSHSAHRQLVTEEAMLCCTILMISSRFFMLPGAGGVSRSHFVHNRLWNYCEVLIKRIMLGQEKHSTWKMRVIGTIESLMLISDWHPRAIHFPPETEGWDVYLISPGYDRTNRLSTHGEEPLIRWREDVFEPAKRANRMSWMLLGMANTLAYEIGVFSSQDQQKTCDLSRSDAYRHFRVQKLLFTYVFQTATKLNLPSPFNESVAITASQPGVDQPSQPHHRSWSAYMELNTKLIQLSHTASGLFFQTHTHLQNLVSGSHYIDLLDHFFGSLSQWRERAEIALHDHPLRNCLLIEFYHLKIMTGAVAIQAIVARAIASGLGNTGSIGENNLTTFVTTRDTKFHQQVIWDCEELLHIVAHSDFRAQFPYAPARIKLSVISASVFLLKALSIGSSNTDAHRSLNTLEQCTTMLKSSAPDDTDFAMRYAVLIEKHVATMREGLAPPSPQPLLRADVGNGLDQRSVGLSSSFQNFSASSYGEFGLSESVNSWMPLPFDSSMAPFNSEFDTQLSFGLDLDSLNFLWNLPLT